MAKDVALVLSSGGARGLAHIGAIEELEAHGYRITSIAGCSMGALIGGVYAAGKLEEFREWMKTVDRKKMLELTDFSFSLNHLVKGTRIIEAIMEFVPDIPIEDLPIPYCAIATDWISGREVVFREVHFTTDEHVRMTALKSVKVDSKAVSEVMSPSRQLKAYGFSGNTAFTMDENDDIMTQKGVSRSLIDKTAPSVFLEDLQLMLNKDGETVLLSPNGTEETYIWPSISPDKKHILYYVGGEGAYVCDMEGKNVKFIAHDCRAPQWYDNNTIIGMDDKDDGERLLTSCIMAYTLDGKSQRLTDPVSLTMYPYCSKTKGVVACSTGYGEIYLINLTK